MSDPTDRTGQPADRTPGAGPPAEGAPGEVGPSDDAPAGDASGRPVLWGLVALLAVFLAGAGVGVLLAGDDAEPPAAITHPALFDDLDLTPDQRAHVDSVLAETRAATDAVLEETRLELTGIATDALEAIDRVLTPEQIETVRERIRQWEPSPEVAPDSGDGR